MAKRKNDTDPCLFDCLGTADLRREREVGLLAEQRLVVQPHMGLGLREPGARP